MRRITRIVYAIVAFSCALAIRACGAPILAQQQSVTRPYDEETQLYNRLDRQDAKMDSLVAKIDTLDDRINWMQGIGVGGMGVLGVLQLIGLLVPDKEDKEQI